jgi:hypothetical protein
VIVYNKTAAMFRFGRHAYSPSKDSECSSVFNGYYADLKRLMDTTLNPILHRSPFESSPYLAPSDDVSDRSTDCSPQDTPRNDVTITSDDVAFHLDKVSFFMGEDDTHDVKDHVWQAREDKVMCTARQVLKARGFENGDSRRGSVDTLSRPSMPSTPTLSRSRSTPKLGELDLDGVSISPSYESFTPRSTVRGTPRLRELQREGMSASSSYESFTPRSIMTDTPRTPRPFGSTGRRISFSDELTTHRRHASLRKNKSADAMCTPRAYNNTPRAYDSTPRDSLLDGFSPRTMARPLRASPFAHNFPPSPRGLVPPPTPRSARLDSYPPSPRSPSHIPLSDSSKGKNSDFSLSPRVTPRRRCLSLNTYLDDDEEEEDGGGEGYGEEGYTTPDSDMENYECDSTPRSLTRSLSLPGE